MRRLVATLSILLSAAGCKHAETVFVQTEPSFRPHRAAQTPRILWSDGEVREVPLFRSVGVIELRRNEVDTLDTFSAMIQKEATLLGCDIVVQRDVYEMRTPVPTNPMRFGARTIMRANGLAAWQFICGTWNEDEGETRFSRRLATEAALKLRDQDEGELRCSSQAAGDSRVRRERCGPP